MKKNKSIFGVATLLSLFFVGFLTPVIAQEQTFFPGHYISNEGDLVQGFFDYSRVSSNVIRFYRNQRGDRPIKLLPSDVKEIVIKREYEYSIITKEVSFDGQVEQIFVVPQLIGKVALYKGNSKEEGRIFFISTVERPEVIRINSNAPGEFLRNYLGICDDYDFQFVLYDQSGLLKAIGQFNECRYPGESYIVVSKDLYPIVLSFGVEVIGFGFKGESKGGIVGEYDRTFGAGVGGKVRASLSRTVAFTLGVNYFKKDLIQPDSLDHSHTETRINIYGGERPVSVHYRAPIEIAYSTLEIPFAVSFYLGQLHNKIKYRFTLGSSGFIHFNEKIVKNFGSWKSYTTRYPLPVEAENFYRFQDNEDLKMRKYNYSLFGEVGINFQLPNMGEIEIAAKYAYEQDFFYGRVAEITGNRLALSLGFYFQGSLSMASNTKVKS